MKDYINSKFMIFLAMYKDIIQDKEVIPPNSISPKPIRCVTFADVMMAADSIKNVCHVKTIIENGTMWIYNPKKGSYERAESHIQSLCARNLGYNTRGVYKELMFNLEGISYIPIKDFESPPNFINLKNAVIDVEKNTIINFDPRYNFKFTLNIEYAENASCPIFEEMIKNMMTNQEDIDLIQRWFGYHFIRGQLEKKALFIVGPTDAGKTTLLWTLQQLIGEGNYSSHSLHDISNDTKYYVADMQYKLANINADISAMGPRDISMFKQLTGGDMISAREIRQKPKQFCNEAKMTFACNRTPNITEPILSDKAFWNRIMLINVKRGYEIEDKLIRNKLKEELPGILNWAIDGLKDYHKKGLGYNKNCKDTKEIWIQKISSFGSGKRFSEDELTKIPSF